VKIRTRFFGFHGELLYEQLDCKDIHSAPFNIYYDGPEIIFSRVEVDILEGAFKECTAPLEITDGRYSSIARGYHLHVSKLDFLL